MMEWLAKIALGHRVKYAAIVLLAGALVLILYWQFGSDGADLDSEDSVVRAESAGIRGGNRRRPAVSATVSAQAVPPVWPSLGAADALIHNPFVAPAAALAAAERNVESTSDAARKLQEQVRRRRELRAKRLEELQATGMTLYFDGQSGASAAIGSRRLRIGDTIDGFRVVDVRPDGILLEDTGTE